MPLFTLELGFLAANVPRCSLS